MTDIAAALHRVEKVLTRSPKTGLHEDAPAVASWDGGTRVVASHANGISVVTDLPVELGGAGSSVPPGWLLRAGLASCLATRLTLAAAVDGIELKSLEVVASSTSDARGMLGMTETSGEPVSAGPFDVRLVVRISAINEQVTGNQLRTLVERCHAVSPVSCAVQAATPIELCIETGAT